VVSDNLTPGYAIMAEDEPGYESYTLAELQDALRWIDRGAFPERVEVIEREIRKRNDESPAAGKSKTEVALEYASPWQRRTVGFIVDLVLVGILWGITDNLLQMPLPRTLTAFGFGLFLFVYFSVFESVTGQSPGKKAARMRIRSHRGSAATWGSVTLRAFVVAAIVGVDWDVVLTSLPRLSMPMFVVYLVAALGLALYWTNAFLVFASQRERMIQDWLTRTIVEPTDSTPGEPTPSTAANDSRPFKRAYAVILGVGLGFSWILGGAYLSTSVSGSSLQSGLSAASGDLYRVPRTIESRIASDIGIRTHVEVEQERKWTLGEESTLYLKIRVWVPVISWTKERRAKIVESAVSDLKVTPGTFDAGAIVVWTGKPFLKIERSHTLNWPESGATAGPRSRMRGV
jgi:uncharacterized RDD family membrane protein YckC